MHFQQPMLGVPLDWSNPLNDGLVMHLAMNEGHGDVVRDLSMNGNHGTLKNMAFPPTPASGWNPGMSGVGLNFDGTDDYIRVPNTTRLHITDAITLGFSFKNNNVAQDNKYVFSKSAADANTQFNPHIRNGVDLRHRWGGGAGYDTLEAVGIMDGGSWVDIVLTVDSSCAKIYKNGVEVASKNNAIGLDIGTSNLKIMSYTNGLLNVAGSLGYVRIYNRALTAKEVKDYYINPWQVYLDEDDM